MTLFIYRFAIKLAETLITEQLLCKAALPGAGDKRTPGSAFPFRGSHIHMWLAKQREIN